MANGAWFDIEGPLDALRAIAADSTDIGTSYVGIPTAYRTTGTAFVAVSESEMVRNTADGLHAGVFQRRQWYVCGFGYQVHTADAEAAERALARWKNRFEIAIADDPTLGGLSQNLEVDTSQNRDPKYANVAEQERRVYTIMIGVTQRTNVAIQKPDTPHP